MPVERDYQEERPTLFCCMMMARDAASQKKELSVLVGGGLCGVKILGEATAAASRILVKVKASFV